MHGWAPTHKISNYKNIIFDSLKAMGGVTLPPSPSFYFVDMNILVDILFVLPLITSQSLLYQIT
jgi:hypothetical protein